MMSRVRSKDTVPELIVRRMVYGMGYRYRLHVKQLPGKPDLVFRKARRVIFVHSCFFHQHSCGAGTIPKTHTPFWRTKLRNNVKRDAGNVLALNQSGWRVLTVWQCELKDRAELESRLRKFLNGANKQ